VRISFDFSLLILDLSYISASSFEITAQDSLLPLIIHLLVLELLQQGFARLLKFADCRLRSDFCRAPSTVGLRHCIAGQVDDFSFTLHHLLVSVGTGCFYCLFSSMCLHFLLYTVIFSLIF
jgi:hypothetical protein